MEQWGSPKMSMRRIKACLMTAVCAGLMGLVGTNALGQAPAPAAAPAPCTQKIQVTEYVPTMVDQTVTVMQQQQRQEAYTAYRTEWVPQTVTKQVTVNKRITETVNETRTVTESRSRSEASHRDGTGSRPEAGDGDGTRPGPEDHHRE